MPNAPDTFKIVGKGGSLSWQPPGEPQYNMIGWGLYLRDVRVQDRCGHLSAVRAGSTIGP